MSQGYCHSSALHPTGLPGVNVHVIWDGGAEGTSISAYAMSRLLGAQKEYGIALDACPLRGACRMVPGQRLYSFTESAGQEVDILSILHLATRDGAELPPLTVRMVPGQIDALLSLHPA